MSEFDVNGKKTNLVYRQFIEAHIVHQNNEDYVLRYLGQRKIVTRSKIEFLMNWQHRR